ncbi:MAG: hypothetical protein GX650_06015 [Clostridiales bacterium]|nr:hypothetical protein [Clostridiales bacterium]
MAVHEGSSYIADIDVYELPKDRFSSFSGQVACEGEGLSTSSQIGRLMLPDGGILRVGSARFYFETGGVTFDLNIRSEVLMTEAPKKRKRRGERSDGMI